MEPAASLPPLLPQALQGALFCQGTILKLLLDCSFKTTMTKESELLIKQSDRPEDR